MTTFIIFTTILLSVIGLCFVFYTVTWLTEDKTPVKPYIANIKLKDGTVHQVNFDEIVAFMEEHRYNLVKDGLNTVLNLVEK